VYWNFWDSGKIDARLLAQVRTIFSTIPEGQRRPLYVTEFGVRGLTTIEGEPNFQPGLSPDGTDISETKTAAFQEAWFMLRATQIGYSATSKWDLYQAKYDNGTQDYSAIGPGVEGWPVRPVYNVLRLLTATTQPRGGSIVSMVPSPGADPAKLVTAYVSPAGNLTILGLDENGGSIATTSHAPVAYSLGGLPPNTQFRLVVWNADGGGGNTDIGYLSTDEAGSISFAVPLDAVFALTNAPTASVTW
jgi:hypothetical protein